MPRSLRSIILFAALWLLVLPAHAYIGPGAGISVLGGIISVVVGVFVAIGAILLWPVRKAMKRRKAARESAPEQSPPEA